MFTLVTADCPKGYAYVRDYTGNLVYYGSIDECHHFINAMNAELMKTWEELLHEKDRH